MPFILNVVHSQTIDGFECGMISCITGVRANGSGDRANTCPSVSCSVVPNSLRPMGCSLPGSSVHGIFQARILEWVAISFSNWGKRRCQWAYPTWKEAVLVNSQTHLSALRFSPFILPSNSIYWQVFIVKNKLLGKKTKTIWISPLSLCLIPRKKY